MTTTLHIDQETTPVAQSPGRGGGTFYYWHIRRDGALVETGIRPFHTKEEAAEDGKKWAVAARMTISSVVSD